MCATYCISCFSACLPACVGTSAGSGNICCLRFPPEGSRFPSKWQREKWKLTKLLRLESSKENKPGSLAHSEPQDPLKTDNYFYLCRGWMEIRTSKENLKNTFLTKKKKKSLNHFLSKFPSIWDLLGSHSPASSCPRHEGEEWHSRFPPRLASAPCGSPDLPPLLGTDAGTPYLPPVCVNQGLFPSFWTCVRSVGLRSGNDMINHCISSRWMATIIILALTSLVGFIDCLWKVFGLLLIFGLSYWWHDEFGYEVSSVRYTQIQKPSFTSSMMCLD